MTSDTSINPCQVKFCNANVDSTRAICDDLGKKPGARLVYRDDGQICYCLCPPGIPGEATITSETGVAFPIALAQDEMVLACGLDGILAPTRLEFVRRTGPSRYENMIQISYDLSGANVSQVLAMDVPIYLHSGDIVAAGQLRPDDHLRNLTGDRVAITDLSWGAFEGEQFEIATALRKPDATMCGHFVLRDGILLGDFAMQLHAPEIAGLTRDMDKRPLIGSPDWEKATGLQSNSEEDVSAIEYDLGSFLPAQVVTTDIPDEAIAAYSAKIKNDAPPAHGHADTGVLHAAEHDLKFGIGARYPAVNFTLDWYRHDENFWLWQDGRGQRHLVLSGALLRRRGLDVMSAIEGFLRGAEEC